jgi:geranylgeranyl pyrophosphate synthase
MARPPAYRLYCGELATMHAGNDLQELIKRAEQLGKIFGDRYQVKDTYGNVVWEGNNDGKA